MVALQARGRVRCDRRGCRYCRLPPRRGLRLRRRSGAGSSVYIRLLMLPLRWRRSSHWRVHGALVRRAL